MIPRPPTSTLFPTRRSSDLADAVGVSIEGGTATHHRRDVLVSRLADRETILMLDNCEHLVEPVASLVEDRKSTRLNSSHPSISYAVFCLKKKKKKRVCNVSP